MPRPPDVRVPPPRGGPASGPPAPSAHDSQTFLVQAIAEEALGALPGDSSRDEIEGAVDQAVRHESRRMERVLAEVRVAAIALGLAALAVLALAPTPAPAGAAALAAILVAWGAAAGALLVALHRDGYRRWMRKVVPVADALVLALLFTVAARGRDPVPAALVAAAGAVAVLLAFLGPARLSRSASRVSPIAALALWVYVGVASGVPAGSLAAVGGVVLAGSYLGARLTRGVRRLIFEQVRTLRLTKLYESAQDALDAREQVLGIVCHDLRTPLTTIAATAGLLLEIPVPEEDRAHHLRVVQRVTHHMDRLIHDLLDVSRIEAGTLAVAPEPCALGDLLERAEEVMRPVTEGEGVDLQVRVPDEPGFVLADAERIQQVLCNLIGNAAKFSGRDTLVVLDARPAGAKVRISVTDQGPGVPQDEMDQLWKRLWQATPGDRRGLGLGLTIARSIVEAHGESIGADSRPGVGTEFWFTLSRTETPRAGGG